MRIVGTKILCSECKRNGYPATLLGIVEEAEGTLRLWCRRCRKEIRVEIRNGKITTRGAEQ